MAATLESSVPTAPSTGDAAVSEGASIRSRVLSAVMWATVTRLFGQALNWAMTLAVVRFLHPDDYGLMALTSVVLSFFQSLSYVGLSDALVQSNRVTEQQLRDIFGLMIVVNCALALTICLLAYPIAGFYREPRLVALLQAASVIFLLMTAIAIPRSRLEKALNLKQISRVEIAANLLSGILVLVLAWYGFGVWALLLGMLFGTVLRALGFQWLSPYLVMPSFTFRGIGNIVAFGGIRTIEQVAWNIYMGADIFIIGRLLNSHALGEYSIARTVAELPIGKLAMVVKPVAFPAFALVQEHREKAVGYLVKAMRLLGLIAFPLFFGLSATAPEAVHIVLGPQWTSVILPLQILAFAMPLRTVGLVMPSFLQGIGQVRASLNNTLLGLVILPIAFAIGCQWGVVGVCIGWLVGYPIQFLNITWRIARVAETTMARLLAPLAMPLIGAAVMYGGIALTRPLLAAELGVGARLTLVVAVGILVYGVYVLLFGRALLREAVQLVRR